MQREHAHLAIVHHAPYSLDRRAVQVVLELAILDELHRLRISLEVTSCHKMEIDAVLFIRLPRSARIYLHATYVVHCRLRSTV